MESPENKVILITGGSGAIGSAMVQKLLTHGAKGVAIVDLCEPSGLGTTFDSKKVIFIKTDITNEEEFKGAFEKTVETFQQLDIVINNAALMDEIQWKKMIDVNLTALTFGTYLAMKEYLPKYKSEEESIIINIASRLGFEALDNIPVYCATKHGVVGLGMSLGTEEFYRCYKVKIVTVCPSSVDTSLLTAIDDGRFLFPNKMVKELNKLKDIIQTSENVAEALIRVIKKGQNGSLWIVGKNEPPYEVMLPKVESMKIYK